MTQLPAGTVTFLFTDIQGSTPLWERDAHAMQAALAKHNAILEKAIREHGGRVFKIIGDAFQAAFPLPDQAVRAAIAAQRALQAETWGETGPLRVRMGIHIARAEVRGEDYAVSHDLNRVARIMDTGHGGQILISASVADLAHQHMPKDINLQDMGQHQLKGMVRPERLYQVRVPDLPAEFPPLATQATARHNLPAPPTPLVGRQREMAELLALLGRDDIGLVTLTGPGGTGKTRLALEAAHRSVSHYPDGVFFISLAPLQEAQLVPAAIAGKLEVPESQGEPLLDTLKGELAKREILLLLDNFEHLIVAAPVVAELLAAAPGLNVLVTSRERLRLRGEHEFPLDPLPVPDLEKSAASEHIQLSPAVTLFLQRAQAVLPSFQLSRENAAAVAEICILLDGLPLAIELAAARVKLFSPHSLLDRLKDGFTTPGSQSPMRLLSFGASDAPARQQTLENTLEWSYRLLSSAEQALLRRLGVFAGGFTLQAVEAVCYPDDESRDGAFEEISSLLEKSLIQRSDDDSEQARFSMLFILRQFSLGLLEQAGELPVYNARHAAHFLSLAEQAKRELTTNNRASWFGILEREHDNLRAALSWAISNRKVETGSRLAISLSHFWWDRGYPREGRSWLEQVLSLEGIEDFSAELQVNLLKRAGWFSQILGDFTAARSYAERCLEIHRGLGDRQAIAASAGSLGYELFLQGEFQSAAPLLEESIALFRETDDKVGLANSLNKLARLAMHQGNYPLAQKLLDESLPLLRDQGNLEWISEVWSSLGNVQLYQGNYDSARRFYEQSFKIYQSLGKKLYTAEELGRIGTVCLLQGNLMAARSKLEQALKGCEEIGTKVAIPEILAGLAGVAAKGGNPERAVRMFGAAEALCDAIGMPLLPADQTIFDPFAREARTRMSKADFARAWTAGRQLLAEGLEAVIDYALDSDAVPDKKTGTTSPCGLTVREVEVLRLVAQGLTDAQVAEQLVISPRTVNAHLTSIYSKMGVNSRAAATRFAVEEGLV